MYSLPTEMEAKPLSRVSGKRGKREEEEESWCLPSVSVEATDWMNPARVVPHPIFKLMNSVKNQRSTQ